MAWISSIASLEEDRRQIQGAGFESENGRLLCVSEMIKILREDI